MRPFFSAIALILVFSGCHNNDGIPKKEVVQTKVVQDSLPEPIFSPVTHHFKRKYVSLQHFLREIERVHPLPKLPSCYRNVDIEGAEAGANFCAQCNGTFALAFDSFPSTILHIEGNSIDLKNLVFENLDGFAGDTISRYAYTLDCESAQKFTLGQDSFLCFEASIRMCNGFACGFSYSFLFHFNEKRLYAFELFRGTSQFADVNGDNILDYIEINPLEAYTSLDTISVHFYTLDGLRQEFTPLKNEKNEPCVLWMRTAEEDYRFAKNFNRIERPKTNQ